jgi:Protein-tyrosine-phosphatase-like, N-terminal domain
VVEWGQPVDEGEPILRSDVASLEQIVPELARQFDGVFTEAEIYQLLFETYANLRQNSTVHEYLETLARRQTRDRLAEATRNAKPIAENINKQQ